MIGNDVIDLNAARCDSNWQRAGFLQKLFSCKEQDIILMSRNPEIMVWVLWSMKEAAYKIYNRQTGIREFIPHKLLCADVAVNQYSISGNVFCNSHQFYASGIITNSFVHTICTDCPDNVQFIKNCTKAAILKDNNNLPYVISNGFKRPASVSHHGKFYKAVFRTDIVL